MEKNRTGAGAQEENIFRRSNYHQSLEDPQRIDAERRWRYPLQPLCGIYSPDVRVFRCALFPILVLVVGKKTETDPTF